MGNFTEFLHTKKSFNENNPDERRVPEVEFLLNFSLLCILAVIVERSDLEEALGILSQLWISGGAWRVVTKW